MARAVGRLSKPTASRLACLQVAEKTGATIVDVHLTDDTQEVDIEDFWAKLRPGKTKVGQRAR